MPDLRALLLELDPPEREREAVLREEDPPERDEAPPRAVAWRSARATAEKSPWLEKGGAAYDCMGADCTGAEYDRIGAGELEGLEDDCTVEVPELAAPECAEPALRMS